MKVKILLLALMLAVGIPIVRAQQNSNAIRAYRNFPIVVGVQFQSIGRPFKTFKANFANPGFRIGTEVSLTGRQKQDWAQAFTIGWNYNKHSGNSFVAFTQTIYRPVVVGDFLADIRLGIGLTRNMHPSGAWQQASGSLDNKGSWGKTMLLIPTGIGVGYNGYHSGTYFSPFATYEVLAAISCKHIIPVLPASSLQVGARLYPFSLSERK